MYTLQLYNPQLHASFVEATLIKALKPHYNDMHNDLYYIHARNYIHHIIDTHTVMVAVDPDDYSHIYGFICYKLHTYEPAQLTFLYVKSIYRNSGIASTLIEPLRYNKHIYLTFNNNKLMSFLKSKCFSPWYQPFLY